MKSSIVLIFNPIATKASGRKIARASHFLRSKGYKAKILFTKQKGHAESLAREAVKESPSLIIAAGGDGTFNEIVNGIAGSEIPMAILPLGTTNVLAKELGLPETVDGAMEVAVRGTPKTVSIGKISITCHSSLVTRYFLLMAGIGFDGDAVFRINETLKKISGKGAYIFSGFKTLSAFNPDKLILDMDGKTYTGYSVIISKVAKYGGNFKITPDARLTDSFFYVCLFKGKGRLDILRYVTGIVAGKHLGFRDVECVRAKNINVEGDAHIQIDGDYFGRSPARIEVVPDTVRLVF
jgi:YegS/Rv2252/BmrU family lipid kinase